MPLPNPPPCARCGHAKAGHFNGLGLCGVGVGNFWLCACRRYVRKQPKAKEARRG
jgi:hypothetical protein